jgi:hypothetical protein
MQYKRAVSNLHQKWWEVLFKLRRSNTKVFFGPQNILLVIISSSTSITIINSSSDQAPSPQSLPSLQTPPLYRISRGIKTTADLYRQWYVGLAGTHLVKTLEQQ